MSYLNRPLAPRHDFNQTMRDVVSRVQEPFKWLSARGIALLITAMVYITLLAGFCVALTFLFTKVFCFRGDSTHRESRLSGLFRRRRSIADAASSSNTPGDPSLTAMVPATDADSISFV